MSGRLGELRPRGRGDGMGRPGNGSPYPADYSPPGHLHGIGSSWGPGIRSKKDGPPVPPDIQWLHQPLYSWIDQATGFTEINFFDQANIGAGDSNTNLGTPGQLAAAQWQRVHRVIFTVAQGEATADEILLMRGVLVVTVSQTPRLKVPIAWCGGGGGVVADQGGTLAPAALGQVVGPEKGFNLREPIYIPPGNTFEAKILYPASVTLSATTTLCLGLDGFQSRPPG